MLVTARAGGPVTFAVCVSRWWCPVIPMSDQDWRALLLEHRVLPRRRRRLVRARARLQLAWLRARRGMAIEIRNSVRGRRSDAWPPSFLGPRFPVSGGWGARVMAELVEFVCRACGPRVETYATATVWCRCGRRCSHGRDCCCRGCVGPPRNRRVVTCANVGVLRQNRSLSGAGSEGGTGGRGGA